MGIYIDWKKWCLAVLMLIGFNLFNNKILAQNPSDDTRIIGRIFINLDEVMYATPAMGEEVFAKKIKDIVGKNGVLSAKISLDTAGYVKKFTMMDNSAKQLGIDSVIQKKVEDAYRTVKWLPANSQNRIFIDKEFYYTVKFINN